MSLSRIAGAGGLAGIGVDHITSGSFTSQEGDLLVAVAIRYSDRAPAATPLSDSKGNTWYPAYAETNDTNGNYQRQWFCVVGSGKSGSGHTITFTLAGTGYPSLCWAQFRSTVGFGTGTECLDRTGTTNQDASAPYVATTSAATTADDEVLVGGAASAGVPETWTTAAWDAIYQSGDGVSSEPGAMEVRIVSSTGTYSTDFDHADNSATVTVGIATYKEVAGGGTVNLTANIAGASTTPSAAGVLARALLGNIGVSSTTPNAAAAVARAIIAAIVAQSLTPDLASALPTVYGLEFWRNADAGSSSDPMQAIQFDDPQNYGLPIWGPSDAGVTVIREVKTFHQASDTDTYYAQFWWSNNGNFNWDSGSPNTYWGFHPYPKTGQGGGEGHWHEIGGMESGGDQTITRAEDKKTVVYDTWMTQAIRITHNGNNTKTAIFYTELPSVANADVIEFTSPVGWGDTDPPDPAITIGDSPWYGDYGHECFCGVLGRIKIFDKVLSEADMLSEAADMSRLVTTDGQAHIWWGKNNFDSVDDLTCDYGTARSFHWFDADTKATRVATPLSINNVISLLANIGVSSTTPDIAAQIVRALIATIPVSSLTPEISAAILRALFANIGASSTTPDITATMQGIIELVATVAASSSTPDVVAQVVRALLANIPAAGATPDIAAIVQRNILASLSAGSNIGDIQAVIARSLLAAIAGTSVTPDIATTISRAFSANVLVVSTTPDITATIQGIISLVASITGVSSTSSFAAQTVRELIANIPAGSITADVIASLTRRLAANVAALSSTPDITATVENMVNLSAAIVGASVTPDVSATIARLLTATITAGSLTPELMAEVARTLVAAIAGTSITPDDLVLILAGLGVILDPSMESVTPVRVMESETPVRTIEAI